MADDPLLRRAADWLAQDPDPRTAAALRALLEAAAREDGAAAAELADAFSTDLAFGTAGLRGRLGPGSNRMNRVVVTRAAAGLARYLRDRGGRSVVIGYDARHSSDVFARDTAQVMAGAGIATMVLPQALPTPVLAFGIRFFGASAGVMVTASHNPPQDNGYKVYLGDGSQIVPPADTEIANAIAAVGRTTDIPRSADFEALSHDLVDAYVNAAASLIAPAAPRDLRVVSTSLHGVGHEVWVAAMRAAGYRVPSVVLSQAEPDPDFPTVAFPNPEEAGAADLLLQQAAVTGADVAIAHDPDADRCAAGVLDPQTNAWRLLTGDELGTLLGWWSIERARRFDLPEPNGVFACSIVSSTLLLKIARAHGITATQTLTGFKWIGRVDGLDYGYEEALGYCVAPQLVADKDGITAALRVVEMAATLKAAGRTLLDALDDIYAQHGRHATAQLSVRMTEIEAIKAAVQRLREHPPTELAGRAVVAVDDLAKGVDGLPPTDGVRLRMHDGQVIVRPSGTEPKLKCYLEYIARVDAATANTVLAQTKHALQTTLGL